MNTQQTNNKINLINMNGDNMLFDRDETDLYDEDDIILIEDLKDWISDELNINYNLINLFIEGEEDEPNENDEADKETYYLLINKDICKIKIEKMLYGFIKSDYLKDIIYNTKNLGDVEEQIINDRYIHMSLFNNYKGRFNMDYLQVSNKKNHYIGCPQYNNIINIIDYYIITKELLDQMRAEYNERLIKINESD